MTQKVRTRFAPSPTGFIHLGNIRSALYPWAFARATGGDFILRIEDTDVERSTQASVDVIIEGMAWLQLDHDEGPFYQMQRMDRYKEVLAGLQASGHVYPCYMSVEELDALRERQMANKEKPRYDGTWRPEEGKVLPPVPEGVRPVLRFKTPKGGVVAWEEALGASVPVFAHLPTVLNEQGEKMSKRNGAKAVTQYRDEGYLPDAMVNYLARLGWSHGDDEIFSRAQFLEWFNLDHLGRSAGQFDEAKLRWVNAQHLKALDDAALAELVRPFVLKTGLDQALLDADDRLPRICALFKDRCETLVDLAGWVRLFYVDAFGRNAEDLAKHVNDAVAPALDAFAEGIASVEWSKEAIAALIKEVLKAQGLKMPQLAMPVRVLTLGTAHTPSVDAVLELLGREKILARLKNR